MKVSRLLPCSSTYTNDRAFNASPPYAAYYTEKSFEEISRAFEAIRPDVAAEYLGLDPSSNVVEALTQKGWTWDAQAQLLRPNLPTEPVKLDGQRTNGIPRLVGLVNKAS